MSLDIEAIRARLECFQDCPDSRTAIRMVDTDIPALLDAISTIRATTIAECAAVCDMSVGWRSDVAVHARTIQAAILSLATPGVSDE